MNEGGGVERTLDMVSVAPIYARQADMPRLLVVAVAMVVGMHRALEQRR